ncbi:glucose-6-phosphate dehydrogenase [Sphingomonas solaris]|uniref:Glucose-6-phosphate 1-dehydrogenase n=1 Tax=Alterirhizorhabdus solaris TaxID=2529389 RepID=A0A558R6X0_9SPHN|nr:glucose-6-phosphate dehydrogenase [Sphingomonas solaris]TVV75124.1 glucose-6-phosphate dehydrogenase [Sphingomonas solaris]
MSDPVSTPPAAERAPPATLVIFGAMGDLAKRLLMPSILNLMRDGLVGDDVGIVGVSHHDADDAALRDSLGQFVGKGDDAETAGAAWQALAGRIHYVRGSFEDAATYATLADRIEGNAAFYLATAPGFFGTIVDRLADAGILDESAGFRRVLIEKPFGHDLASAQALNARILARIPESQIYRVDHFLGKETVQNIMVARFGNALLEAVWNSRYIDHVQITAAETVGVGTRGTFYDATGALRDMVPNHLFQLLAMIGMEPPNSFDAEAIRNEKAKLLAAVRGPRPERVERDAVRGRYRAGQAGDATVPAYREERDIAADSRTETYAAIKLEVETWRWAGVPFYLRTGKALAARDTEIVVMFKPVPFALFRDTDVTRLPPNRLVLQVQPDEGISLDFVVKKPGPVVDTREASLDFRYADSLPLGHRTGYETLLYDALTGDQTLFQRADMIEAGWAAVQPVLDEWGKAGDPEDYDAGSAGPAAADELLARDGRQWHRIGA